jgi:hypothetical protein
MRHAAAGFFIFLIALAPARGVTRTLRFSAQEGLCSYAIRYPSDQEDQVKGTIELLAEWQGIVDTPMVSKPDDISKVDASTIDSICAKQLHSISRLLLLPLNGVDDYRRMLMAEINAQCRWEKLIVAGHRNPAALREHPGTAACSIYVDALEGKANLDTVFNELGPHVCRNNASPQRCLANWQQKGSDTAQKRIEVQSFGWQNCVVGLNLGPPQHDSEKKRLALFDRFLKQYRVKKIGCDT